jgi:hypothetical protein
VLISTRALSLSLRVFVSAPMAVRTAALAAATRPMAGLLLSVLLLPRVEAFDSLYEPTCPVVPPQQLTLQGDSVGQWEDSAWLSAHGDDKLVGAAYAYVPPMSLRPGDKLAFDTSVLGTDAMNMTLSLSSCVPTRTVDTDNSEEGLTYTCEETLMPEHTVRPLRCSV